MECNEADLIGYLLNTLDDSTADQIHARLAEDADTRDTLAQLKLTLLLLALLPVEPHRTRESAPADLALRTIGFVAEYLVHNDPTINDPAPRNASRDVPEDAYDPFLDAADAPSDALFSEPLPVTVQLPPTELPIPPRGWRYANVIVACSLAGLVLGLLFPLLSGMQRMNMVNACQNNLRQLHASLTGYADTRNGALPMITGHPPMETAASFIPELIRTGQWTDRVPKCPSTSDQSSYAYTLGYRDDTHLLRGLNRDTIMGESELLPVVADRVALNGIGGHSSGQNVLFVGGHVRLCNTPNVGINGDSIYTNQQGQVAAGINRWDSVLGSGDDRP